MNGADCCNWTDLPIRTLGPGTEFRAVRGDNLMVARYWLRRGAVVAQHHHPEEQVICVLSGSIDFELSGSRRVLKAGDVAHVQCDASHGGTVLEDAETIEVFSPPRTALLEAHTLVELPDGRESRRE
jgi:quercetin dioxygenase-like cupin family protein